MADQFPSPPGQNNPSSATDAFRHALLELTRVTEQTAIFASFLAGTARIAGRKGLKYKYRLRPKLLKAFLQAADHSLCEFIELVHVDPEWQARPKVTDKMPDYSKELTDVWSKFERGGSAATPVYHARLGRAMQPERLPDPDVGARKLYVIPAPVDGLVPLIAGQAGGTVSALVGSLHRNFGEDVRARAGAGRPRWFVLLARDSDIKAAVERLVNSGEPINNTGTPLAVEDLVPLQKLFQKAARRGVPRAAADKSPAVEEGESRPDPADRQEERDVPRLIGALDPDEEFGFRKLVLRRFAVDVFPGSPIGATITLGQSPCMSALVTVVRDHAVYIMAALARAFDLGMLAVPVYSAADSGEHEHPGPQVCRPGTLSYGARQLIPTDDVFSIVTAVTNMPFQDGVQVSSEGVIATSSLVVNLAAHSNRSITHRRPLEHDVLKSYADGTPKVADAAIKGFLDECAMFD
jgi:hypothetical protein